MTDLRMPDPAKGGDPTIRIFIVEDDSNLRSLLGMYCHMQDDFTLCGEAGSAEEALQLLHNHRCDPPAVVLIDFSLPGRSGTELVSAILDLYPEMICLMLSGHKDPEICRNALEAGARGYLLKGNPQALAGAVRRATAGEQVISPEMVQTAPGA